MKLYALCQNSYTFGQTGVGCHVATSDEEIVASATLWDNNRIWEVYEEKEKFMRVLQPTLHVLAGTQWVAMPIEPTVHGFDGMVKILRDRTPSQAYIQAGEGVRFVFSDTVPVLAKGHTDYDPANLNHQRALLGGKA